MNKAILFLTFNRPDLTRKVFKAIKEIKPPRLYVSSDGPRNDIRGEKELVQKTRQLIINGINWNCEVFTRFNKNNNGCRKAVSESINWFFEKEKDGIILEDDCLPSKSFFTFCEELLNFYKDNKKIMHIAGHNFSKNYVDNSSYFFTKLQFCWGWATWADRWQYYGNKLNDYDELNLKKLSRDENVREYWGNVLKQMKEGKIDTWDYQWMFRIIEREGICANPSVNLVSNIGFDIRATHTVDSYNPSANLPTYEIEKIVHPRNIKIDEEASNYIYKNSFGIDVKHKPSIFKIIKSKVLCLD